MIFNTHSNNNHNNDNNNDNNWGLAGGPSFRR